MVEQGMMLKNDTFKVIARLGARTGPGAGAEAHDPIEFIGDRQPGLRSCSTDENVRMYDNDPTARLIIQGGNFVPPADGKGSPARQKKSNVRAKTASGIKQL